MLSNFMLLMLFVLIVIAVIVWLRIDKPDKLPPNTLINHRQKRMLSAAEQSTSRPDVSSAHAHEQKLEQSKPAELSKAFQRFKLITSIQQEHKERLLLGIENIRKPHPLLNALTGNISNAKELYDTVRTDPELVAKIINVANSPLFGLSKPITNVHHAIVYLGVVQVKNIATHFALQKSVEFENTQQQMAYQQIWAASFLASAMMLIIAKALHLPNAAELSTRCQLCYLGDISILFSHPDIADVYLGNSTYLDRLERMQSSTGANTGIIGALLAKKWNLPASIITGIEHSHLPLIDGLNDGLNDTLHDGLSDGLSYDNATARQNETSTSITPTEYQEILVCYCCCRIAEAIIYNDSSEVLKVKELSFEDTGLEEFFYLPQQLQQYQLTQLSSVIGDDSIKAKLMEVVNITIQKLQ